jgi:hypothetical protein
MKNKTRIFSATLFAAGLCLWLGSACSTKQALEWPEITRESKPWSRWWWHGSAASPADITAALEAYQKAGLGGLEITPIYGVRGYEDRHREFLSPEWMELFTFTLKEAERLGLGIDMANTSGWPFGGPWIGPEHISKNINSQVFRLKGGEMLTQPIRFVQQPLVRTVGTPIDIRQLREPIASNPDLQEHAFDQVRFQKELPILIVTATNDATGETIELTDRVSADSRLDWIAPAGDWTVCALFMGEHGKMVERAGPGGEGWVIDHFSEPALKQFLGRIDSAFAGSDVSSLRYYFNDSYEVDDAQGDANWTPLFFDEFAALRGYDLRRHLPALLGVASEEENNRVKYDYYLTISDLLLERYTRPWQAWAAAQGKGIRNQAHGSPANVLDLYAASDVPETEGYDILSIKSAPSAQHVTGRKYSSTEGATWLGEHFVSTLEEVKTAMDRHLLGGVNHSFYHGTTMTPVDIPWPGWLFYAATHFHPNNPFWEDFGAFNRYMARAQSFLQRGRPDNDVLVYYSVSDVWSKPQRTMPHFHGLGRIFEGTGLQADAEYLQTHGYAWDLVSDKQLIASTVSGGAIVTEGGQPYRTLFLTEVENIPIETFRQILALAEGGATIALHNALPVDVAGFADLEANRGALQNAVAGLTFTENNGLKTAVHGKGRILIASDLDALMAAAGIRREAMYDNGLECIRRANDDGTVYFIANRAAARFEGWVPMSVAAASAGIFNPQSGAKGYGEVRKGADGKPEVYLQLDPNETVIVYAFSKKRTGEPYLYYQAQGGKQPFDGTWDVTFTAGGPELPAPLTAQAPQSWVEYGPVYAVFSGTADYTTTLPAAPEGTDGYRLDLGKVGQSASVYLNDDYLGTLFGPVFALDIDRSRLADGGRLTVKVSNSMLNRVIDLDKRGVEWKTFYNTNFPARIRTNSENGLFTAAGMEPMPSGLIGPVTLTPLGASGHSAW